MNKTETNLQQAITGEARARLKYTAFAMQAMQEGHPEVAQLFLEAAGAETIHGISHLRVAGGITSTLEHLDEAANGTRKASPNHVQGCLPGVQSVSRVAFI